MAATLPFPFLIEPLGKHHHRAAFSSGSPPLDHYLQQQAGQEARRHLAVTFVLVDADRQILAGYYTLSATSIRLGELPTEIAQKLPRYPLVPATLLGRLAVDTSYQGKRLGEFLLMDALRRSFTQSQAIASMAVVVDAKDEGARRFYERYGFIKFPDQPFRLFLPMQTIAKLFS
ncbi:MAG: GNAT family N-acetyltransferase [Candidatus Handelsmanbacteria bacterium]|nr:GNAT family N-acetyltransferase [Candidatus Handelsmanbacteria bacterium]